VNRIHRISVNFNKIRLLPIPNSQTTSAAPPHPPPPRPCSSPVRRRRPPRRCSSPRVAARTAEATILPPARRGRRRRSAPRRGSRRRPSASSRCAGRWTRTSTPPSPTSTSGRPSPPGCGNRASTAPRPCAPTSGATCSRSSRRRGATRAAAEPAPEGTATPRWPTTRRSRTCSSAVGRREAAVGAAVAVVLGRAPRPAPKSILSCSSRQIRVRFLSTVEMVAFCLVK
jgi:hypothetical protein